MTTRDARLSAEERAALAGLEAAAAADDPQLAARLRGPRFGRIKAFVPRVSALAGRMWRRSPRNRWWGVPLVAAGVALLLLSPSFGLAIGICGAVVAGVGLLFAAAGLEEAWRRRSSSSPE